MASVHRGLAQRCAWAATLLAVGAAQLVAACSGDAKTALESGGAAGEQNGEAGEEAGADARGGAESSAGGATLGQAGKGHGGAPAEGGEAGMAGLGGAEQSVGGAAIIVATAGAGGQAPVQCPASSIIAQSSKAWAIALDGGYVYWTTRSAAGQVLRAPVAGGPSETVASGQSFPYEVAAAGGQAFWATLGTEPGHLYQGPVTGGAQQQLSTGVFNGIYSLWADQNFVYYITNLNEVTRVPVGGGTPITLSAGLFNTIDVDLALQGSNLYWTNNGVNMFAATEPETAGVFGVDVAGATAAAPLVSRLNYPQFEVAADNEHVFWSDGTAIYSTSKIGGAFATVTPLVPALPDVSPIVDLVSDGTHLFYSDGQRVYRVSVSGGTPEVVSAGWNRIMRLAVDDTSLYFTDYVAGVVVKLPTCTGALTQQELGDSSQGGGGGTAGGTGGTAGGTGGTAGGTGGTAGGSTGGTAGAGGSATCDPIANPHGCPAPTVAMSTSHPYGLALDADHLYYSTLDASGSVMRIPLGGSVAEPIATGEASPFDIAVDDTNVYWCLADQPSGHVVMAPKAGGMRQQLAVGDAFPGVGRVTSDGTYAYYVGSFNVIYRVAVAGGPSAYVAAGPDNSIVNDVALYDGELFWANDGIYNSTFSAKLPGTGYVGRAPVTGSSNLGRTTLKGGLDSPVWRTAVDGDHVFAIDGSFIYRGDRQGGGMTAIAPSTPATGQIYDMLSDGVYVYFVDSHAVYRLPVAGGTVETLSGGWTSLRSIAVNATDLYFTDLVGGVIMRRPK
jgi:hypothetical protein